MLWKLNCLSSLWSLFQGLRCNWLHSFFTQFSPVSLFLLLRSSPLVAMPLSPSFSVGMALVVEVMNTGCARHCASSFAQIVQLLSHQTRECPLMLFFTKYVDVATLYSYGGCSKGKCLTWWRAAERDQSLCYYFTVVVVVSQASWEYPRLSKLFHTFEMCFSKFPAEVYKEFPWLCGLKWIVSFTYKGYTLLSYLTLWVWQMSLSFSLKH